LRSKFIQELLPPEGNRTPSGYGAPRTRQLNELPLKASHRVQNPSRRRAHSPLLGLTNWKAAGQLLYGRRNAATGHLTVLLAEIPKLYSPVSSSPYSGKHTVTTERATPRVRRARLGRVSSNLAAASVKDEGPPSCRRAAGNQVHYSFGI